MKSYLGLSWVFEQFLERAPSRIQAHSHHTIVPDEKLPQQSTTIESNERFSFCWRKTKNAPAAAPSKNINIKTTPPGPIPPSDSPSDSTFPGALVGANVCRGLSKLKARSNN